MPILSSFTLPKSAADLSVSPTKPLFVAFLSSKDPVTKEAWCPDVRVALPRLDAAFSAETSHDLAYIEAGQRPEWKQSTNTYRTQWNVHNVPTLVRYERVDGEVKEVARLVEGEILDTKALEQIVSN